MIDMIQERRNAESKEELNDLMSGILDASDEEFSGAAAKLSDREVISESSRPFDYRSAIHSVPDRQHIHLPDCWSRGISQLFLFERQGV